MCCALGYEVKVEKERSRALWRQVFDTPLSSIVREELASERQVAEQPSAEWSLVEC